MNVSLIDSIEKLEKLGFKGSDVCLATSLFEYDIAWLEKDEEIIFVYSIKRDEEPKNCRFDRCSFKKDLNFYREFSWSGWEGFFSFIGTPKEEFDALPLAQKIASLFSYYGYLNVFGNSYWEGFEILEHGNFLQLEDVYKLLEDCAAASNEDGDLFCPRLFPLNGEDENQFAYFSWRDEEGCEFSVKINEGENRQVVYSGSLITLVDHEGKEFDVYLLQPLEIDEYKNLDISEEN